MSLTSDTWEIQAHAKINLFLEILGRRENGYHDLRGVLMPIALYDVIRLRASAEGQLLTEMVPVPDRPIWSGEVWPSSSENLATRAARALREASGISEGARIHIEKRIPLGGGLGGGSADAAATLIALNRLWQAGHDRETLMRIGARVGCDIPALVHGGVVCLEGLGEKVTPIARRSGPSPGWWVTLVNPRFGVSTRDTYARCEVPLTRREEAYKSLLRAVEEDDVERAAASLYNGLESAVFRKYPLIRILAEELRAAGALGVLVAGSGATVFGLARSEGEARSFADRVVRACQVPLWTSVVRTLPDGVMAAHGPLEARV